MRNFENITKLFNRRSWHKMLMGWQSQMIFTCSSGWLLEISIDEFETFLRDKNQLTIESISVKMLNFYKNWWAREPIFENWWVRPNPSNPCQLRPCTYAISFWKSKWWNGTSKNTYNMFYMQFRIYESFIFGKIFWIDNSPYIAKSLW